MRLNLKGYYSPRHSLRRLKYFLIAFLRGEIPRKSILSIVEMFDEKYVEKDKNFNRVVFLTWKSHKLTRGHLKEIEILVKKNPEWKFLFFDDNRQWRWMKEHYQGQKILEVYSKTKFGASRADIFRFCIIDKYGGAFFSINMSLDVPIDSFELPTDKSFLILSEALLRYKSPLTSDFQLKEDVGKSYVMEVVIGTKNNPALLKCLENICIRYEEIKGKVFQVVDRAIWAFTGPFMFTDSILETKLELMGGSHEGFIFHEIGFMYGGALRRPVKAKSRYISSSSYIGYANSEIASREKVCKDFSALEF